MVDKRPFVSQLLRKYPHGANLISALERYFVIAELVLSFRVAGLSWEKQLPGYSGVVRFVLQDLGKIIEQYPSEFRRKISYFGEESE